MSGNVKNKVLLLIIILFLISLSLFSCIYNQDDFINNNDNGEKDIADLINDSNSEFFDIYINGSIGQFENPNIIVDSSSKAHILWRNEIYNTINYTKINQMGKTIVRNKSIILNDSSNIKILIDSNENIYGLRFNMINNSNLAAELLYLKRGNDNTIKINDTGLITIPLTERNENIFEVECRVPSLDIDSKGNLHIAWEDWSRFQDLSKGWIVDIYYMKLDSNGNILIKDTRLTNDGRENRKVKLWIDSKDNTNIIRNSYIQGGYRNIVYRRFSTTDNILKIIKNDTILCEGRDCSIYPYNDYFFVQWQNETFEKELVFNPTLAKFDLNGNKIQEEILTNWIWLFSENFIIYYSFEFDIDSCGRNNLSIYFFKQFSNGTVLINNSKLLRIIRNESYDHGPSIFCFKGQLDMQNNIHLIWYVNNGVNGFQVHYLKMKTDGNILDFKVIAPSE